MDHFERGKLLLTGVEVMVIDEADRMLDMGFIPDIERIFQLTPFTRQTLFFSATMAPEIERITNMFLSNPARVEVARQATTAETIEQALLEISPSRRDRAFNEKRKLLRKLIRAEGESCSNAIIFCNRKIDVDVVAKSLKKHGFNAAPIHGDLDQSVRTRTLEGFRDGSVPILVASDVAARGLDIPDVTHVFNFDVPSHSEDYVHRIGRTGRAGRSGKAFTIATPSDEKYVAAIESLLQKPLPRGEAPEGFDDAPRPDRKRRGHDEAEGDKPRRSRRRKSDAGEESVAAETAKPDHAPAEPVAQEAAEAESRKGDGRNGKRDGNRDDKRDDKRRDEPKRGRGRGRRDDNQVVGMGDHVPEFMKREFKSRKKAS